MIWNIDKIPQKMRDTKFWIIWHRYVDGNKIKKIPDEFKRLSDEGKEVSWKNVRFSDVGPLVMILNSPMCHSDGLGIAFTSDNMLAGIDIDDALHEDGSYNEPVRKKILPILAQARKDNCYIEKSISITGYHIYGYTTLKPLLFAVNNGSGRIDAHETHNTEIHYANTYFVVSGRALSGNWGCLDNTIRVAYELIKGKPLPEQIPSSMETPVLPSKKAVDNTIVPPTIKPPEIDGEYTDADVLALPGMEITNVLNIMSKDHRKHGASTYEALKNGYPDDNVNKSDFDAQIIGTLCYWLYRYGEEEICRVFRESALYRPPESTPKGKQYLPYTVHKMYEQTDIFFAAVKKPSDDIKAKLQKWMIRKSAEAQEKARQKGN